MAGWLPKPATTWFPRQELFAPRIVVCCAKLRMRVARRHSSRALGGEACA
jgi:hypothetical protein